MTEEAVRAVFFKNYSGDNLNEALMASIEEIMEVLINKALKQFESLPEIIETIKMGRSRVNLLEGVATSSQSNPVVPMSYLLRFDELRKAMVDVVRYTRDNLETMDQWFKDRFKREHLEEILKEMASATERSPERPFNVRAFRSDELKLYGEFFNSALIGIIGPDNFLKYAEEYNRCVKILRQCQIECRVFFSKTGTKES